jgi:hypothetical protein
LPLADELVDPGGGNDEHRLQRPDGFGPKVNRRVGDGRRRLYCR